MRLRLLLIPAFLFIALTVSAQKKPRYTPKKFSLDTFSVKRINPGKEGFSRTFILTRMALWDLDDDSTTYVSLDDSVMLTIEGQNRNYKRDGVFTYYLTDFFDSSKRYKIYEQTFKNDELDGEWRTYTLRGGLIDSKNMKKGSFSGLARTYAIDRVTIVSEVDHISDREYIERDFYPNKKIKSELSYKNGKLNGPSKRYYENGRLQEYAEFKNNDFHGIRRYYYENGQMWIEQTYIDGKNWSVNANYTEKGVKRDAGTLKNGNGTIIFYDENGSVREVQKFENGVLKE